MRYRSMLEEFQAETHQQPMKLYLGIFAKKY